MKHFSLIKLLILIVSLTALFSCKKENRESDISKEFLKEESGQPKKEEIYKVDVGNSIYKGPENAPVTIINFSDFQCPFSKRSVDLFEKLLKDFDGKIRYVFKNYPLPFHRMGKPASLAAIAAGKQGKFWEYHDILFGNMKDISDENLLKWAEETGLDLEKFKSDRNSIEISNILNYETSQGGKFGVRGTPTIFINGRRIVGANNQIIEQTVKEEIANGEKLRAKRVKDIYGELIKDGLSKYTPPKRKPPEISKDIYKIEYPPTSTFTGNRDGEVTVVIINDYECSFCSRMHDTIEELKNEYKDILRFVHINFPLRFHKKAVPAALAALAASRQDKFPEMNDLLFKKQSEWKKAADFESWIESEAVQMGLDITKFNKDRKDPKLESVIETDKEFVSSIGVRGTPASFINGRHISGALPVETLRIVINEEIHRAQEIKSEEVHGDKLYYELIKNGKPGLRNTGSVENRDNPTDKIVEIKLTGQEPRLGKEDSIITIIEFSDFQCPFCKKGSDTIKKIIETYDGRATLIFKHFPLDFNKNSKKAALFAIAVNQIHGSETFFSLKKTLFENQKEWRDNPLEYFERYSQSMKLDWEKIKLEMKSENSINILESDIAAAAELGLKGAPQFFINGRQISGVKNPSYLKAIIDGIVENSKR
jgi:protein-disulfide isomerase